MIFNDQCLPIILCLSKKNKNLLIVKNNKYKLESIFFINKLYIIKDKTIVKFLLRHL